MTMRILFDTNIIIALEDNKIIEANFSDFFRYATSNQYSVYYHPDCLKDISRDKDAQRREIILSKFKKYELLQNPAGLTEEFIKIVGQKNENDRIDNKQLFQLYSGYVELFVTEDKEIKKKAQKIDCRDNVLSIKDALNKLKQKFDYTVPRHPVIYHCSVRKIKERINESFFDSLKADYKGFSEWFEKCIKQDRECYNIIIDGKLAALLIYNIEQVEQHQIAGIFEKTVKMCTFKINDDAFGLKVGELFLNKMFQYCIERNINYLYLTQFEKFKFLVGLLTKFGFEKKEFINKDNQKELIMLKNLRKDSLSPVEGLNSIKIHPFHSDSSKVGKFIIPIRPQYYNTLFKDSSVRQRTLFDKDKESLNEIQGNSIIKAYICNANVKNLKKGDILLFYSSKRLKLIQPIGILDTCARVDSLSKLKAKTRGKTVFSEKQLEKIFEESPGNLLVIIFRLIYYLKRPIELNTIHNLKCFSSKFITIQRMPESDYIYLKKEGFFDERYIIY
jgi:hypothetical protein